MVWGGGYQLQLADTFDASGGNLNSVFYIIQVVNSVLLIFLRQRGGLLFQQDNAHPHTAATTQRTFRSEQQLTCPERYPDLSQLTMYGTLWRRNLLFLQSLPQPLPNRDNGCKMLGTVYRRMTFGTFMTFSMREYTPALPLDVGTMTIDVTIWAPLSLTCVFHLVLICHKILL